MIPHRSRLGVFLLLVWLPLAGRALSSEMAETDSFDVVADRVESLAKQYGPREVLFVCDIDNTILTMNQGLGGVAWFDDQVRMLREEPQSDWLVGRNFDELLRAQELLFALSGMHPPEKTIPDRIAALQEQGVYTLCLTSRGPAYRNSTEEALRQNRLDFARSAPSVVAGFRGRRLPYQPDDISASGLSAKEAQRSHLGKPRLASCDNGVFMVSGQNKGAMLLIYLAHCPRRFSAIVFVDDKEKHVKDVFTAVVARDIEIVAYRYGREDRAADEYNKTGRQKAHQQWQQLRRTLDAIFQ